MNDRESEPAPPPRSAGDPVLFAIGSRIGGADDPGRESAGRSWLPWILAAIAVLMLIAVVYLSSGDHASARLESSSVPYANHLVFSDVHLTQTTNFAGDQLTYVGGVVSNGGHRTVTGISLRVLFASSTGDPPQVEQVPLLLVRVRQPFIETEPVSAAPLVPGSRHDFQLTFDDISPDWNHKIPALAVENVALLR